MARGMMMDPDEDGDRHMMMRRGKGRRTGGKKRRRGAGRKARARSRRV